MRYELSNVKLVELFFLSLSKNFEKLIAFRFKSTKYLSIYCTVLRTERLIKLSKCHSDFDVEIKKFERILFPLSFEKEKFLLSI